MFRIVILDFVIFLILVACVAGIVTLLLFEPKWNKEKKGVKEKHERKHSNRS